MPESDGERVAFFAGRLREIREAAGRMGITGAELDRAVGAN